MLKFSLAVILAAIAGGALWIEQGHHSVIEAPAAGAPSLAAAAVCPDNDTMPYDARCLEFLNVAATPRLQVKAVLADPSPCPDNDKVPYSASCIAFLKGATETGMRWRATDDRPQP